MGKRVEKLFVERIALPVGRLLHIHLGFEPTALLSRVREFAKAIGKFDAAGIELEAFGETRITGERPGQGGFLRGVFAKQGQAPLPQFRLDVLDQNAAEKV